MSHGFIALLDILVVALDGIVVVLEAVLLAGDGNTVHVLTQSRIVESAGL